MEIHKFELRKKQRESKCSSQSYTQRKQLRKESLKTIQTRLETRILASGALIMHFLVQSRSLTTYMDCV